MRELYSDIFRHVVSSIQWERMTGRCRPYTGRRVTNFNYYFERALELGVADPRLANGMIDVFMNTARDGCYVEGGLEDLKRVAGLEGGYVEVPAGGKLHLDFNSLDRASTADLEQFVAVASRTGLDGTISHLKLDQNPYDFMDWLEANAPRESMVYLIGGMAEESAAYVKTLEQGLQNRGFEMKDDDILTSLGFGKDVTMRVSGLIEVELYRRVRDPEGMTKIPVQTKHLV